MQLITKACDTQALHFLWRPQLNDVADEMVLETAINGRVDMLVTFNQRHLHDAAQRFARVHASRASLAGTGDTFITKLDITLPD